MILFFVFCFSPDFRSGSDNFFGSFSNVVNLYYAFSFLISLGFFLKAYNRPFHGVLLGGGSHWRGSNDVQYNEIHRFIAYRNGLMGGMSPENGAQLMKDTAIVDAIINGTYSGRNTRDTAKYINGRLGGIAPKNQINFLKGLGN